MEQTLLGKVIVVDTIEKFETLKEGVKKTPFLYLQLYAKAMKELMFDVFPKITEIWSKLYWEK